MKKRDETIPDEKVRTVPGAARDRYLTPAADDPPPTFEWQAVLLRYLPDPRGSHHSVKRFAAR